MNRLIKAEWYRFWRASKFKIYFPIFMAVIVVFPLLTDVKCAYKTLDQVAIVCADLSMIPLLIASIFVSIIVGIGYQNKTAYYEVMAGNKIPHIIFSKVIVEGVMTAAGFFLAFCVIPVIAFCRNGAGELDHVWLRLVLIGAIILHLCIGGVMITTSIRHIAGAAALTFLRFYLLEGILYLILTLMIEAEAAGEELLKCGQWLIAAQLETVFIGKIDAGFVIAVIGSLLLEMVFWYTISYVGMKKKKYY